MERTTVIGTESMEELFGELADKQLAIFEEDNFYALANHIATSKYSPIDLCRRANNYFCIQFPVYMELLELVIECMGDLETNEVPQEASNRKFRLSVVKKENSVTTVLSYGDVFLGKVVHSEVEEDMQDSDTSAAVSEESKRQEHFSYCINNLLASLEAGY